MDTRKAEWYKVCDLPSPLGCLSGGIIGDNLYLGGGKGCVLGEMVKCSVPQLLRNGVWSREDAPFPLSTLITTSNGVLLSIGGEKNGLKHEVKRYNEKTEKWELVVNMTTPRFHCLAAALPDGRVLVVGGKHDYTPRSVLQSVAIIRIE